jgi:hypothetical protein
MKIRFEVVFDTIDAIGRPGCAIEGQPFYIIKDRSFYYDVKSCYIPTVHLAYLATSTIQLHINVDTNFCTFIDGYHPYSLWELTSLRIPNYSPGLLKIHADKELLIGVGYQIEDMVPPSSWFDTTNGWWCIGRKEHPAGSYGVGFATGCVAVVVDERLVSLWIRPDNWLELVALLTSHRMKQ